MKRRRIALFTTVAVLVVAATGIVLWIFMPDAGQPGNASPVSAPSTATPIPPLDDAQAAALSTHLAAGTEADLRAAVALSADQPISPEVLGQLKTAGPFAFDVATFHDNGDGTAVVTAHAARPSAGTPNRWQVQLVAADGRWKISTTEATP